MPSKAGIKGSGYTGFLDGRVIDVGNDASNATHNGPFEAGLRFYNDTGGTLTAGTVVYKSSYVANVGATVLKSDGDAAAKPAIYVVLEDTANLTQGVLATAAKILVAALDGSGGTVGDAVYLSTTAGEVSLSGTAKVGVLVSATNPAYVAFDIPAYTAITGGAGAEVLWPNGTAALPGLAKATDTDTGFWGPAANQIGIAVAGVSGLNIAGSIGATNAAATDTAGQDIYIVGAAAGGTATAARVGGLVDLRGGNGSAGATTVTGGAGGAVSVAAGGGGAKTGTTGTGGAGGAAALTAAAGGTSASTSSGNAGAGGHASVTGGAGGAASGASASAAGGAGGNVGATAGVGGAATGGSSTGNGGTGGAVTGLAGDGGATVGGTPGTGGATSLVSGAGGAAPAGTGGTGGATSLTAGAGGAGTTGGAGGAATITAGAAGTGGNANGGNINLVPGAATGTGTPGEVRVNSSAGGIVPVSFTWVPTSVDAPFFVATRAYRAKLITSRVEVAGTDGGAVTAVIKKAASGTAITAGTALHTGSIDIKGTAATNQVLTPSATAADLEIAAGTCIGIDFTGTLTSAVGCVTINLVPV